MKYDLVIANDDYRDIDDPVPLLPRFQQAVRAILYVSAAKRDQYVALLNPDRISKVRSRVYCKTPDSLFEWGQDWEPKQKPINPPAGAPPGVKCFKVVRPSAPKITRVPRSV